MASSVDRPAHQEGELSAPDLEGLMKAARLFCAVDAVQSERVPEITAKLGAAGRSLYASTEDEDFWAIGPHLWSVEPPTMDWLQKELWSKPWGIFIASRVGFDTLFEHLQGLNVVEGPDGTHLNFRYYDPRVLPAFIPTCTEPELAQLFGPADAFVVPPSPGEDRLRTLGFNVPISSLRAAPPPPRGTGPRPPGPRPRWRR